jgi:hypothetical protein
VSGKIPGPVSDLVTDLANPDPTNPDPQRGNPIRKKFDKLNENSREGIHFPTLRPLKDVLMSP